MQTVPDYTGTMRSGPFPPFLRNKMEVWTSSPVFLALVSGWLFVTALVSACIDRVLSCWIILRGKLGGEMRALDTQSVLSFSRV